VYTLISGSPKFNLSNSMYFLNIVKDRLNEFNIHELKNNKYEQVINDINNNDALVLAFPLYVDSPTSVILKFFDYIIDNKISLNNKLVYVIINCGFREGEQNLTALNIVKRWCEKVGAIYSGSLLIGAGEVVGKKEYKFLSRNVMKKLDTFANNIKSKQNVGDIITTMDLLNNQMYCYIANLSWDKKGKKNNLSKKDLIAE